MQQHPSDGGILERAEASALLLIHQMALPSPPSGGSPAGRAGKTGTGKMECLFI